MPIYKNSKIDCFYYDGSAPDIKHPCQVRIETKEIVIDYEGDGERVLYSGKELSPGHFELSCEGGHASLHRFDNSIILEGSWKEDDYSGMWKIWLA